MQQIQVQTPQVQGYSPGQTRAAFNAAMAQAHASADPRFNMKPLDTAGLSRGKGQQSQANIAAARNLADGVSRAYAIPAQDASANAAWSLGQQQADEGLGLGAGAIAAQDRYNATLEALQRQQDTRNFTGGLLNGLLGSSGGNWLNGMLGF